MERKYWYAYTGAPGGEGLISNYTLIPNRPANCPDGPNVCAIYALYGGDTHPLSLSSHILDYIGQGKVDFVKQPRVGLTIVFMKVSGR